MKNPDKLKLTDEERHKRFLETAKKVNSSEKADDFDAAFKKIVSDTKQRVG